jgi:DNA polymerase III gamma/tau subunit
MPAQPPDQDQMALIDKPSWEQVYALLKDNAHRNFRIDIETDSTIAGSLESDMQGLQQVLTGVSQFLEASAPMVQAGYLPLDAAKEIVMTITRRSRMGMAVEDALDKMKAPPPAPDDGKMQIAHAKLAADQQNAQFEAQMQQQQAQQQMQSDAMKAQAAHAKEQAQMQADQAVEAARAQADMAIEKNRADMQAQLDQLTAQKDAMMHQSKMDSEEKDRQFDKWKAELESNTRIAVAEISAGAKKSAEATPEEPQVDENGEPLPEPSPPATLDDVLNTVNQALSSITEQQHSHMQAVAAALQNQHDAFNQKHAEVVAAISQPKKIDRGPDGKAIAVNGRPVVRDKSGKINGLE